MKLFFKQYHYSLLVVLMSVFFALNAMGRTYDTYEVEKLRAFFDTPSSLDGYTNGQVIWANYNSNDPSTWSRIDWNGSSTSPEKVTEISINERYWSQKEDDAGNRVYLIGKLDCSNFTSLESFVYAKNSSVEDSPIQNQYDFSGCTALTQLELVYAGVNSEMFESCGNLRSLVVSNSSVEGVSFCDFFALEELVLRETDIEMDTLSLVGCSALTHLEVNPNDTLLFLDISDCKVLDYLSFDKLIGLNASNCFKIEHIYCRDLISLDVSGCRKLTELKYTTDIKKINITGCTSLVKMDLGVVDELLGISSLPSSTDESGASISATVIPDGVVDRTVVYQSGIEKIYHYYDVNLVLDLKDNIYQDATPKLLYKTSSQAWNESEIQQVGDFYFVSGVQASINTSYYDVSKISLNDASASHISCFAMLGDKLGYDIIDESMFYDVDGDGSLEVLYENFATEKTSWIQADTNTLHTDVALDIDNKIYAYTNVNNDVLPDYIVEDGVYTSNAEEAYNLLKIPHTIHDINNDGLPDFGSLTDNNVHFNDGKGNFVKQDIRIMSFDEYENEMLYIDQFDDEPIKRPLGLTTSKIQDLSAMSIISFSSGDVAGFELAGDVIQEDFNNDGLMDIMGENGILYNMGDNIFIQSVFSDEFVASSDLNDDGVMDFVFYNESSKTVTLRKYVEREGYVSISLMENQALSDQVSMADFDGDGDVDILLPFNAFQVISNGSSTYNGIGALYALAINDGEANFTINEGMFLGVRGCFTGYADVDGDGLIDPLMTTLSSDVENQELVFSTFYCKLKDGTFELMPDTLYKRDVFIGSELEEEVSSFSYSSGELALNIHVADIDGDHKYEIWDDFATLAEFKDLPTQVANNSPQAMPAPKVNYHQDVNELEVIWEKGTDSDNSSADLSYALRIGSASGLGDVVYVHANTDGRRLNLKPGNMGSKLVRRYNVEAWQPQDYYVSIQAIDPMRKGGLWSPEVVFSIEKQNLDFGIFKELISGQLEAVGAANFQDTLLIESGLISDDYHVVWDFADATCIDTLGDNAYRVAYSTLGAKSVVMSVYEGDVLQGVVCHQLQVSTFTLCPDTLPVNYVPTYGDGSFNHPFDFNNDGRLDYISNDDKGLIYENNQGKLTQLAKIFNLSFEENMFEWNDFDMDGDVDIIGTSGTYPNYYLELYTNNGNSNFVKTSQSNYFDAERWYNDMIIDINNDGCQDYLDFKSAETNEERLDRIVKNVWLLSQGDNQNFETVVVNCKGQNPSFIDWNHDGLEDIWVTYNSATQNIGLVVYLNDGSYPNVEKTFSFPVEIGESNFIRAIEDFNGDGDWDVLMHRNSRSDVIWLNDGEDNFTESIDVVYPTWWEEGEPYVDCFDIDNNGCSDIIFSPEEYSYIPIEVYSFSKDGNYVAEKQIVVDGDYFTSATLCINSTDETKTLLGIAENIHDRYSSSQITRVVNAQPNQKPSLPTGIIVDQTEKNIVVRWQHAEDAETAKGNMRYNISIKKAGASGEGAFIISPQNALSNNTAISPDMKLVNANRFPVSIDRFETGEYEVQIQSVDAWYAHSDFSEVLTFKVEANPVFDIASEVCFNDLVSLSYAGIGGSDIVWDFDGASVQEGTGVGPYSLSWDSAGVKTITATADGNSYYKQIRVKEELVLGFDLQDTLVMGSYYDILPSVSTGNYNHCIWELSTDSASVVQNGNVASLVFNTIGLHSVSLTISDGQCQSATVTKSVVLVPQVESPQPKPITVAAEGKNRIAWDASQWPEYIVGVNIYKEGSSLDDFDHLTTVDMAADYYVDEASKADFYAERYYLTLLDKWGNESPAGPIQKTVHLAINKGLGDSWNLRWNAYEGLPMASYRVWRGSAIENMTMIAEVPANILSYTDPSPLANDTLYQLELVPSIVQSKSTSMIQTAETYRTNIVKTQRATTPIFTQALELRCLAEEAELSADQLQIQLLATLYPSNASIKEVVFEVVEGAEFVSVSPIGVVTYTDMTKGGDVIIKASSVDGSSLSKDIEIEVVRESFNVFFYDWDKHFLSYQTFYVGDKVIAPADPVRDHYVFDGWGMDLSTINELTKLYAQYSLAKYKVTFVDWDSSDIKVDSVEFGSDAIAPASPVRDGYTFTGWDLTFDNVASDLTVTAQYRINTYKVAFLDWDGTELSSEFVNHGAAAVPPNVPYRDGHTFIGWDMAHDSVTTVLTVRARYSINTYLVTFMDWDNTTLKKDSVEYGAFATAPSAPIRKGYTFFGWNYDIENLPVDKDLLITAQYLEATFGITFNITDGTKPIAGAELTFQGLAAQTSDANGQIVLSDSLTVGTYTYNLSADGYESVDSILSLNSDTIISVVMSSVSAIGAHYASVLELYPNPATTTVTITGVVGEIIVVYDISGNEVKRVVAHTDSEEIDICNLKPSVYFVRSESAICKLIVE